MDLKEDQKRSAITGFIHNTHEGKYIQGIHIEEIEQFIEKTYITKEEHKEALEEIPEIKADLLKLLELMEIYVSDEDIRNSDVDNGKYTYLKAKYNNKS